ncbi:MAG: N-acetylmuramoyl-L-alanine amidase [Clostridia bacterium]|nr:N-acetylmuramoyl-L-alanine amidase [Clostridia bacterium]
MKKYILKIFVFFVILTGIFSAKCYAKDTVVVLDPGHGGVDSGAVNQSQGLIERTLNLKIARYLKEYLSEYSGISVVMTHNGFSSGKLSLEDRVLCARKNNADLLLCLHCNNSVSGNLSGAEAFVTVNKCLPKYNEECTKIGNLILNNLNKLGIKNRGVKTRISGDKDDIYSDGTLGDYYGIIRYAMMNGLTKDSKINIQNGEGISTVLVEHCFLNGGDEVYLNTDEKIRKLAKADCDAVVQYYGLRLKKECVNSVSVNNSDVKLIKNGKHKLVATISPDTAINKKIKWTSSNEKVAKVNENGEITGTGVGNAIITAITEDGGFTAQCNITVTGLEIEDKEIYLLDNEEYAINYKPQDIEVEYTIEKPEVLKILNNKITPLKEGTSKVTIKSKKDATISETITVNVNKLKENQKIKINNLKIDNFKISRIKEKTKVDDFKKNIEISQDLDIKIDNKGKDFITTNTVVDIIDKKSNKIIKRYKCKVFGDLSEDGKITAADYVYIKDHIMETDRIDDYKLDIADVSRDGKVSTKDYLLIKDHIMNGLELSIE